MSAPLRIGLISQEYPPDTARGGIGTQTWNKARALAALGHRVRVLSCAAKPGPDPQVSEHDGVTVYRLRPPGDDFPVYGQAAYWLGYSWAVLGHLSRLMKEEPMDVLDVAEYGAEGFAYLLDRTAWNWAPVVVQLHGPLSMLAERIGWPEPDSDLSRIGIWMEDLCLQRADALMACSANIADFVAVRHGVARKSIDVVHCGVDAAGFQRAGPGDESPRPTVLFVGNIVANKGARTVFEAVLGLRRKYPDIHLRLFGKPDEELVRHLQARAAAAGAQANVEFGGFAGRAELPALYRQSHVFCSPAQHEGGVANVYLEAMASGRPVVASTSGGAAEAVLPGETGLLVPPGDAAATAAALDRILGDAALRARMGEAARRRVDEYFAMPRYIARVLAVYRRAMAAGEAARRRLLDREES